MLKRRNFIVFVATYAHISCPVTFITHFGVRKRPTFVGFFILNKDIVFLVNFRKGRLYAKVIPTLN